jgi:hypothetical protein
VAVSETRPVFDTDVQVGDLVEVIDIAANRSDWRNAEIGHRGKAERVTNLGEGLFFVLFEKEPKVSAHGRFKVIERDGFPYVPGCRVIATTDNGTEPIYSPSPEFWK